jgi:O-antigen/teichoic acid export membrane protein
VWLSVFNAIIATSRFIAVFASMSIFGFTPFVFFMHQLTVALLEASGLFIMSHSLLPSLKKADGIIGWSFKPVEPILKFALMIAFTSAVWVFVTQTDKLVLSGILPLDEYGYFTLAVLVASGILVLSAPISTVIMPRMARLYAEGKSCEMILLYRNSTQVVSIVSGTAALVIAFYAEYFIYAWTGSYGISNNVAPILRLYALGNGILAIVAFPYYLQYAIGNLRYHLIGNLIVVLTLIPAIIYAAKVYGGVGAGWAWLSVNFIYLFAWVCYVHHKLQPGLHLSWLLKDVLVIFISVTIFLCLSLLWPLTFTSRLEIFILISLVSAISLSVAVLASYSFRKLFLAKIINYLG